MINILLVDDHELVRTGIRKILDDVRGFKVIGEAATGEEAIRLCRTSPPDVVLMDMNMPGIGGLEATRKIIRQSDEIKVIVLSVHHETPYTAKVMQLGAHGYLTKTALPDEMILAIRQVFHGQKYIAQDMAMQIALHQLDPKEDDPFKSLSEREMQILLMITKGFRVPDIAAKLSLSSKTVNTYKYRMYEKLDVSGDVELTHLAIRHKLINSDHM